MTESLDPTLQAVATAVSEAGADSRALGEALRRPIVGYEPFVKFAEDRYMRVPVVVAAQWELRLLCWKAGQGSALHGHGGSGCAFRILSGSARETRVDGARTLVPGDIVTSDLGDVHQIENLGPEPLISLHAYAPTLPVDQPQAQGGRTIAIIGGGFAGSALAVQLLERAPSGVRILLFDGSGRFGRGVAYGTRDPVHRLNVTAARMALRPGDVESFVEFARNQGISAAPTDLLPRGLYGDYVQENLRRAVRRGKARLRVVPARVTHAERSGDGWRLAVEGRGDYVVDELVLASGHLPSVVPQGINNLVRQHPAFLEDPWRHGALCSKAEDRVLIIGTGLTAVDILLTLRSRGHRGPIVALSRHGYLPQPHLPGVVWTGAVPDVDDVGGTDAASTFLSLRTAVRRAAEQRIPWSAVLDRLRPRTAAWWRALPLEERSRFLKVFRPFWEVHRHRAPVESLQTLDEMVREGQLSVVAGTIRAVKPKGPDLEVAWMGDQGARSEVFDRVILCTGADTDVDRTTDPLLTALRDQGEIIPDPHHLGLLVDRAGRAANTQDLPGLYVIGGQRRAMDWEASAVPELAVQAEEVAVGLVGEAAFEKSKQQAASRDQPDTKV